MKDRVKGRRGEKKKVNPGSSLPLSSSSASRLSSNPPITLLTDFGVADYFVGAMKGVILTANPGATIIDITHEIPPQDIEAAAFTLLASYRSFPNGTIHVAVVDPGVGSARLPILVVADDRFFIGPDNGIFSYVLDQEPEHRVFQISNSEFFRQPISSTFHGRDVFAPVAAALSLGATPEEFGQEIDECVRLSPLRVELTKDGRLQGRIIHVDRFGNCVTNITPDALPRELKDGQASLTISGKEIRSFRRYFSDQSGRQEQLFAIWGSAGFLEIAAQNRSAAKILKATRGQEVVLAFKRPVNGG